MHKRLAIATPRREVLVDITADVKNAVRETGILNGLINIYVRGATAGIMIQENWDDSVQDDVVDLLRGLIPKGQWKHDLQDGNGDSHLKAGIVGPSECVPLINGELMLSTWQNIFLCEFDGPRPSREVVVSLIESVPH